ncbi:hypothetical protein T310_5449 [Rasamsonia emersonii CBS 393.64]|uniref:NIF system FeS cluster assembly NifU N-terminal domain-containing protein n=1 Tax=Rasamsonia emersonii (strain ATCC 16479 / CBS 393.64 / IMI 116815) TaxID=1408163 RepID=A0A0F4YQZ8_RASE3|nr:hypothetical protein T310_5449 [Rasamsonia emersonii CBS 393.64]KKA20530.1 hypothetical protein T310_5449 [Rasamsonia emersonii CBS 393.64]
MFRRVLSTTPHSVVRATTKMRPPFFTPAQASIRVLPVPAKRSYHEKDKYCPDVFFSRLFYAVFMFSPKWLGAIASSSYLTELVRGMTLEEASKIRNTEIAKELCLPPVKLHCSMLAEDAIKSAISNYYTKNPKAKTTDLSGTASAIPDVEPGQSSATTSAQSASN